MKISVLMPAYNAEAYIKEAIESILSQSLEDLELIVVDDGSTDATADIVRSFKDERIVLLQNPENLGIVETLNNGIMHCRGEYIARMDSDDVAIRSRLELQLAFLESHPDIAAVGGAVEMFCEDTYSELRSYSDTPEKIAVDLMFNCALAHPSVMLRASVFKTQRLLYEQEFKGTEDYRLWCRLLPNCKLVALKETVLRYRLHKGQMTSASGYREKHASKLKRIREDVRLGLGVKLTEDKAALIDRYAAGERAFGKDELNSMADAFRELTRSLTERGYKKAELNRAFGEKLFSMKGVPMLRNADMLTLKLFLRRLIKG